jgi:hypothetical protein
MTEPGNSGSVHNTNLDDVENRNDRPAPRLPYERDQSTGDANETSVRPDIQQGFDDLQSGLRDTDLRVAMDQINDADLNPDTQGVGPPAADTPRKDLIPDR